ncbi:2,3-butanediol dehydrogenase [Pseudoclavibacter soli]|uniref:2,3-butanediol dehydrogenase n=1 Tax=Pseudoclavibacter soli TaxID=452623 RepID=UPI0006856E6A|nr:2,3-butanediol dehydrogenase [Pseudoclavibacter soli]
MIEDIPQQPIEPGTVRVDVAWNGICGTDLHEFEDGNNFVPPAGHPHVISGESAPITLGHEFSGVVSEIGEGVNDLAVGDHVVIEPYIIHDDVDTTEANPTYQLSPDMNFIGLAGRGGGLSENIVVKRRWVHRIDKKVPLDEAALIEPLTVAYHAVRRADPKPGEWAIVGGAGPIGLLVGAVLKALGLHVVVSELSPLRRQKALDAHSADYALNPAEVDVVEEVRRLSGGEGADVAFEATSVQPVLDTLVESLAPCGRLVIVAIWNHRAEFDIERLLLKEIDIRGSIAYANDHPKTIELVESGRIDLKPFITKKIALEHLVDEGFDTLINHKETAVKVLVSPSGAGLED